MTAINGKVVKIKKAEKMAKYANGQLKVMGASKALARFNRAVMKAAARGVYEGLKDLQGELIGQVAPIGKKWQKIYAGRPAREVSTIKINVLPGQRAKLTRKLRETMELRACGNGLYNLGTKVAVEVV